MTNSSCIAGNASDVKRSYPLTILLVDDDLLNIKLLAILLAQHKIQIEVAENGKEAVQKLRENIFDIVLMDMEMPVMNGYQAVVTIREELKNNTPIIAMTAHASAGELKKCLNSGMNGYIEKPVTEDLLLESIYKLAHNSRSPGQAGGIPHCATKTDTYSNICNLSYLTGITRGNKEMMGNIIRVFLDQTPEELSVLHDAVKKMEYTVINDTTHKIKSSFAILGIIVLKPIFEEIEELASIASGIDRIAILYQEIKEMYVVVKEEMKYGYS